MKYTVRQWSKQWGAAITLPNLFGSGATIYVKPGREYVVELHEIVHVAQIERWGKLLYLRRGLPSIFGVKTSEMEKQAYRYHAVKQVVNTWSSWVEQYHTTPKRADQQHALLMLQDGIEDTFTNLTGAVPDSKDRDLLYTYLLTDLSTGLKPEAVVS